jgi:tetratricopeptide (TPR) repeat protein
MVGVAVVVLGAAIAAALVWFAAEQRRGTEAFAKAMVALQAAQVPNPSAEVTGQAIRDFQGLLGEKPGAAIAAQASYELGNLTYRDKKYPESRSAYELTARGSSPTLRRLAQVGLGYTWEVQKDYPKAIDAYNAALSSLKPGDFLYEDLLMDRARVQELAGRRDEAIATYRQILANPKGSRDDDARGRLASLGVQP